MLMMRSALRIHRSLILRPPVVSLRYHSTAPSTSETFAHPDARLRFAPSPTGFLHLGGLRTALFNHLLARKLGGKWLLRIEDTDQSRLVPGAVDSLRDTLEWAGLDYDEGRGGDLGPYTQSERLDIYRHYTQELIDRGEAYECFCTPDDLSVIRASLLKTGHRHGYDGRCRHLSRDEVQQRKRAGSKFAVRFKSHAQHEKLPDDLIFGAAQPTTVDTGADDYVLMKSDGWPTYHLASVVDDHLMEISHVLRGEEWLPSVTKHHQLYKAFGWTPPLFGHLPLLMNADGTKLSKRTGDVHVEHYRNEGYEPEAVVNFLALMGWDHHAAVEAAASEQGEDLPLQSRKDKDSLYEVFTMSQLIAAFDLSLVNHRRAAVSMPKLDFLNKMTLRRKAGRLGADGVLVNKGKTGSMQSAEEGRDALVLRYQEILQKVEGLKGNPLVDDLDYVGKVFDTELPRSIRISDMGPASMFFYQEPNYNTTEAESFLSKLKPSYYIEGVSAVIAKLEVLIKDNDVFDSDLCWDAINQVLKELQLKKNSVLIKPMRHALTGITTGPGVPHIMEVLGPERSLARLREGLAHATHSKQEVRDNT